MSPQPGQTAELGMTTLVTSSTLPARQAMVCSKELIRPLAAIATFSILPSVICSRRTAFSASHCTFASSTATRSRLEAASWDRGLRKPNTSSRSVLLSARVADRPAYQRCQSSVVLQVLGLWPRAELRKHCLRRRPDDRSCSNFDCRSHCRNCGRQKYLFGLRKRWCQVLQEQCSSFLVFVQCTKA